MSKQKQVERHLLSGKTLTQRGAIVLCGAYRLADIVHKMRRRIAVETNLIQQGPSRYAQYWVPQSEIKRYGR